MYYCPLLTHLSLSRPRRGASSTPLVALGAPAVRPGAPTSFLQGLADGPPSAVQSSHIKIIRICSTSSYTFAKIQAKDIHGVTQPWSALYSPSLTRARAVTHIHTDATSSSPYAHARPKDMRGSRRRLDRDKLSLSPRAAYPCARGARSRKSCSRRLVVATQHLKTKQGGSEVVSGGTCIASGRECVFSMCWCGRERPWRSTHRFPFEMVMLS